MSTVGFSRKRSRKIGLPPGTPVFVGQRRMDGIRITLIEYDQDNFTEREVNNPGDLPPASSDGVQWVNVYGLTDQDALVQIGERFGLHSLVLEDILNTEQRPKLEDYQDYLYLILKMVLLTADGREPDIEQLSIILGKNYVLSLQERPGDVFDSVRERLRNEKSRIRRLGADYLLHALVDAVVDQGFVIAEQVGERVEVLEDELMTDPTPGTLHAIHRLKRQLLFVRRALWPLREVVGALERGDSPLISSATRVFWRDAYDHTIQVMDSIETARDMLSGMVEMYLSTVSNRMNEIMKVLTIIATIFIPLTLISGIYGMNFRYMPELRLPWAYPAVLVLMVVVAAGMLAYFRRRGWI